MKKKLAGSASLSLDQIPLTAESLQLYRHINHQFKQNQTEEGGIETYGSWALPPYVYNPNEKVMT